MSGQRPGGALRAYAELGRVSNLPTTLSNVLVGWAIGLASGMQGAPASVAPPAVSAAMLWVVLGVASLYVAGMALNDLADVAFDRQTRPGRPLPSGRVSLAGARCFIIAGFAIGLACMIPFGQAATWLALSLIAAIVAYDYLHKRWAGSVLLMGGCRGLVYLTAAAAAAGSADALDWALAGWLAGTITLYTVIITIVARSETDGKLDWRKWLAVAMPMLAVAAAWVAGLPQSIWPWLAGGAMVLWLCLPVRFVFRNPPATVKAILAWLAGMSLVDAWLLSLLDQPVLAAVAAGCFLLTAWGHRHIMGT